MGGVAFVAFPIYIAALSVNLQRECLTSAFSHLSLCIVFIATITLPVNNDDGGN